MITVIAPRVSIFSQHHNHEEPDIIDHSSFHFHHKHHHHYLDSPYSPDDETFAATELSTNIILEDAYLRSSLSRQSHWKYSPSTPHAISTAPVSRLSLSSLNRYHPIDGAIVEEEEDMAAVIESIENSTIETAPNSPPGLSSSKSSKSSSSSLRSNSLDGEDSGRTESPHFEELSLDETESHLPIAHVLEDNNLKPESRPQLRRPQPKPLSTFTDTPFRATMMSGNNAQLSPNPSRNRKLSAPSPLAHGGVLQDQSSNLPMGRMLRRGFASYSSPNIAQYGRHLSRSPDGSLPSSPISSASVTPRASHEQQSSPSGAPSLVKRTSWQRKSIAELEAEYNDDDEDVPEEMILENVPISPLPGSKYATTFSRTPSPRRNIPPPPRSPSYTNLHSANVPKNARRPSAPPLMRAPRSQNSRRPPMLQHSNTVGAFPPEHPSPLRKQKSKSWDDDLTEEVRQLSIALEQHERNSTDKRNSAPNSASSTPRRQGDSKTSSKVSSVELPPLQTGNIMIDPLPVSKEKEAVLTRTRPSWLPPKSQKEEKKHLQEWQHMMKRAAKAEKEREDRDRAAAEQLDDSKITVEAAWHDILLNWGTAKSEAKKSQLRWQGISPMDRGAVWKRAVGNELQLSSTSFDAALNRARRLEEKLDAMPAEDLSKSKEYAWFSAIERDAPAVFPSLRRFAPGSPGNQALMDVLKAYAMYRSDVGYVYGTHLIAGLLCLNLRPGDAFMVLANLLNRPLPLAFLVHDQLAMGKTYAAVLDTLKQKHTQLHAHLTSKALDLAPEEYLDPLFRCLFAYNLTATQTSRIWDIYVLGDDQVLIDAAVAVLGLLGARLYGSRQEVIDLISWTNQTTWECGGDQALINAIQQSSR